MHFFIFHEPSWAALKWSSDSLGSKHFELLATVFVYNYTCLISLQHTFTWSSSGIKGSRTILGLRLASQHSVSVKKPALVDRHSDWVSAIRTVCESETELPGRQIVGGQMASSGPDGFLDDLWSSGSEHDARGDLLLRENDKCRMDFTFCMRVSKDQWLLSLCEMWHGVNNLGWATC